MTAKHSSKDSGKKKSAKNKNALLMNSVLHQPQGSDFKYAMLTMQNAATNAAQTQDLLMSELQAARMLNVDMPNEPDQFIRILETRIQQITGTRKNAILILDEESGIYRCLNDEAQGEELSESPRELTWISDHYLQDLLDCEHVIHSFLHHQGNVFGIVAIADKIDDTAFTRRDEMLLEQLTEYLSVQVNHYLTLKRSMVLPTMQQALLKISNRLLCAADSPAIFEGVLAALQEELPFSAGQYIQLDPETGKGLVWFESIGDQFENATPIREVGQFSSLLSLFQSQVWRHPYLYLKGETLGDKQLSEIFGLPDIGAVLLLPVTSNDNRLNGALVFFQPKTARPLSSDALKVAEQVPSLLISACERAHVLEKALEIATTDELTGAYNRRGFYTRFDAEIDRARRNMSPICMVMIDIDHFKSINDTYGHLVGDQVLRELSALVQQNIRKSDLLCRFGGEEFVLVLPEIQMSHAATLIERIRRKVAKTKFHTKAGPTQLTFSAGLTLVETTQNITKDLMQVISESIAKADEALYMAKAQGRNKVFVLE